MSEQIQTGTKSSTIIRWIARALSVFLVVLLGAFFIEHLSWFADIHNLPPMEVVVMQLFHLIILVGFIIAFKWELIGSIFIISGAVVFLGRIGNTVAYLLLAACIITSVLYLIVWWQQRTGTQSTPENS